MAYSQILKSATNLIAALLGYVLAVVLTSKLLSFWMPEERSFTDYATASVLGFSVTLLIYFVITKFFESRNIHEVKFPTLSVIKASFTAAAILLISVILLFTLGLYQVIEIRSWHLLPLVFIALFFQGMSSEVLFRGIFFRQFIRWIGPKNATLLLCTLYASVNLMVDGIHLQIFISHWLFCCILCQIYIVTRNLWVTGAFHGTWLFFAFLPGLLDEHWREGALVIGQVIGHVLLTGGSWGIEASIFCIAILSIVNVYLYRTRTNRGPEGPQDVE